MPRGIKKKKKVKLGNEVTSYARRNHYLRQLGFSSYEEYLQSGLWYGIRNRVLLKNPQCGCCERRATCVHHRSYSIYVLLGIYDKLLMPLCFFCHQLVEFDSLGNKNTMAEADKRLRQLARNRTLKVVPQNKILVWSQPKKRRRRTTAG